MQHIVFRLQRLLLVSVLLFGTLLLSAFPCVAGEVPETASESAILLHPDTGRILFEKNADVPRAPASLTKIVTTIVALESCENPAETLVTTPGGIFEEILAVGGSSIDIKIGETLTMQDLLYAAMLPSACDACNSIAYYIGGGSIEAFVNQMNEFAERVGAVNTHFVNAHGLDAPGHLSTARDIAVILRYALQNEDFQKIIRTSEYIIPENDHSLKRYINYETTIPMLYSYKAEYYRGLVGIKSGYTEAAGRCLSTLAERDSLSFLCVCMGAPMRATDGKNMARADTAALYDFAFSNFSETTLYEAGERFKTVSLVGANETSAELVLQEPLKVLQTNGGGEISVEVDSPDSFTMPLSTDLAGKLLVLQDGTVIGTGDLYFETTPSAMAVLEPEASDSVLNLTESTPLRTALILFAVVVFALLALFAITRTLGARRRGKKRRR